MNVLLKWMQEQPPVVRHILLFPLKIISVYVVVMLGYMAYTGWQYLDWVLVFLILWIALVWSLMHYFRETKPKPPRQEDAVRRREVSR